MDKPTPKTTFGEKPMGGLARIVHQYFGTDLDGPDATILQGDVTAEGNVIIKDVLYGPDRGEPYINSLGTHCTVCGAEIKVMCFLMTGVCSEICRKVKAKEIEARPPVSA